jgi:hypothetical protein
VEVRAYTAIVLEKLLKEEYAKVGASSGGQQIANTPDDAVKVVNEIDVIDGVLVLNAVAQRYNEWCCLDPQRRANEKLGNEVQEDLYVVLGLVVLTFLAGLLIFKAVEPGWGFTNSLYGWIGQRSSSGFSDRPRGVLGVFASSDRFWAPQLMAHPPCLWLKSKTKYFRFYEVASHWPRGTGSQRHSTAKIISKQ